MHTKCSISGGLVKLVAVQALKDGPLVGHEIHFLKNLIPDLEARIVQF